MDDQEFAAVLDDVSAHFASPQDLWLASNLTDQQKIQALRHWEQDLRLMQVAAEENMRPTTPDQAELFKQIHNLLERTGEMDSDSAPTKAGGAS